MSIASFCVNYALGCKTAMSWTLLLRQSITLHWFHVYERIRFKLALFGYSNRNSNRKIQISKAPLKSQAQGTSLFTSAASNQRVFPKNSPWEEQVRFPYGERMRQIRGGFQRVGHGKLRSRCQKVRGGRLGER